MSIEINSFPTVNDFRLRDAGVTSEPYSAFYITDEGKKPLELEFTEPGGNLAAVIDSTGKWNPEEYNLCITKKYHIKNPKTFYGPYGVISADSVLGFAVQWTSRDSKQRGVSLAGEISNSSSETELTVNLEFKPGTIRNQFELRPVFYIKEEGYSEADEDHLASETGTILGDISSDIITVRVEGSGSAFPIYEINDKNAPLWEVKCEWINFDEDLFDETVGIYINRAHPSYKYLDPSSKEYNPELFKEIISQSLFIVICKLKEDQTGWEQIINGNDLASGSVGEAVSYFYQTLNWEWDSPEKIAQSIRNYLGKELR
jgi:hypothetical protein